MENKMPRNNENEKLLEMLSGIKIISHEYVSQLETELADRDKLIERMKAVFTEMLEKPMVEVGGWRNKIKELLEEI